MKVVYKYDSGNHDFSTDVVADDYELQENETFIAPEASINKPVTFDGTKWTGAATPEIGSTDGPTDQVSSTDKAIAALTLQIAQNKADQDTVNAQLLLATAQQTAKETN